MRFRRRAATIGRLTASLLCGLAVCAAAAYGVALAKGYRVFVEMSGSMAPRITTGSLIVSKPVAGKEARVGDVVTFVAPDGSGRLITHRLDSVVRHRGKTGFHTKGDANGSVDPWIVTFPEQVGIEHFAVPWLGYAVYGLELRTARLAIVGFVAMTFAFILVSRIWRQELRSARVRVRRRSERAVT